MDERYDIAVVGGGASGMMAALAALSLDGGLRIAVLERLSRVGKKLMATGNGRCNLTNLTASEKDYHGAVSLTRPAMEAFPPEEVLRRFQALGLWAKAEADGRVYPISEQASSVLDVLRLGLEEMGAQVLCDFEAASLARSPHGFRVVAADGRAVIARRVICASGGLTAPSLGGSASGQRMLEAAGHRLTPRFPALVQLKTDPALTRPLKGIRYDGRIDILTGGQTRRSEEGEVLFTEYGLSGPAVMQLSRVASEALMKKRPLPVSVRLHLLPMEKEEIYALLIRRRDLLSRRALENFLTGLVNKRVGQMLVKWNTGLNLNETAAALTDAHIAALADALAGWEMAITGTQGFDQAQATAGGVRGDEVDPATLQSRLIDGLYLAGEVLDVDGDCGGYNLQWAWASALLAGEACARSLSKVPAGEKRQP